MKKLVMFLGLLLCSGLCSSAFASEEVEESIKEIHEGLQNIKKVYIEEKKKGVVDTTFELLKVTQDLCVVTRGHINQKIKELKEQALALEIGDWETISKKWEGGEGEEISLPEIYKKIKYFEAQYDKLNALIKETEMTNKKILEDYKKIKKIIAFINKKRLSLFNIGFAGMVTKKQKGTTTSIAWQPAIDTLIRFPIPKKDWWAFSVRLVEIKNDKTYIGGGITLPILEPMMPAERMGSWAEFMVYQSLDEKTSKSGGVSGGVSIIFPTLYNWELATGFGPRSFWVSLKYSFF